jgi:ribosomal protein L37AE/L43A
MLSDPERRVLAIYCHDHAVATCQDCRRDFKFMEVGVDVVGRRYYFCPSCRLDLVDDLRVHILNCRSIAASIEERVERSRLVIKETNGTKTSSAILASDSQERARRVLERRVPSAPTQ